MSSHSDCDTDQYNQSLNDIMMEEMSISEHSTYSDESEYKQDSSRSSYSSDSSDNESNHSDTSYSQTPDSLPSSSDDESSCIYLCPDKIPTECWINGFSSFNKLHTLYQTYSVMLFLCPIISAVAYATNYYDLQVGYTESTAQTNWFIITILTMGFIAIARDVFVFGPYNTPMVSSTFLSHYPGTQYGYGLLIKQLYVLDCDDYETKLAYWIVFDHDSRNSDLIVVKNAEYSDPHYYKFLEDYE